MKYSFRPNLFQKSRSVQLSGDTFELLDDQGHVTRGVPVGQIRKIQEYPSGFIVDPNRGRCSMHQCVVSFASGGSVVLKSASYTGPQQGQDLTEDYTRFVREVVLRLAKVQPDAPIISGSMGVVVAWIIVVLLGIGLLILGVAMFLSPLFTNETLAEVFGLAAVACVAGAAVALMGRNMMRIYYPDSTTAAERAEISTS